MLYAFSYTFSYVFCIRFFHTPLFIRLFSYASFHTFLSIRLFARASFHAPLFMRLFHRRLGGKKPGNLNGSCVRDPVAGDYFVISPPGRGGAGRALGVGA